MSVSPRMVCGMVVGARPIVAPTGRGFACLASHRRLPPLARLASFFSLLIRDPGSGLQWPGRQHFTFIFDVQGPGARVVR